MRVLLVDSSHLLHRMKHTQDLDSLKTATGFTTGLLHGFLMSLMKEVRSRKTDKVICLWDYGINKFRTDIFEGYKSFKHDTFKMSDEDVRKLGIYKESRLVLNELLPLCGVPSILIEGFEADDLIGWFSLADNHDFLILSEDADLSQLVKDNVNQRKPIQDKYVTIDTLMDIYKVDKKDLRKALLITKAVNGDGSDTIPGIPGIGFVNSSRVVKLLMNGEKLNKSNRYDKVFFDGLDIVERNIKLMDIYYLLRSRGGEISEYVKKYFDTPLSFSRLEVYRVLEKLELRAVQERIEIFAQLACNNFYPTDPIIPGDDTTFLIELARGS